MFGVHYKYVESANYTSALHIQISILPLQNTSSFVHVRNTHWTDHILYKVVKCPWYPLPNYSWSSSMASACRHFQVFSLKSPYLVHRHSYRTWCMTFVLHGMSLSHEHFINWSSSGGAAATFSENVVGVKVGEPVSPSRAGEDPNLDWLKDLSPNGYLKMWSGNVFTESLIVGGRLCSLEAPPDR